MNSFFRNTPLFLSATLALGLAACGGNEQVKDDVKPTEAAEKASEQAVEAGEEAKADAEAKVEEEAAAVEAAAAPVFDINLFKGQGRVTAAKNAAGVDALKISSVAEGSGWEKCGIASGDVLVSVGGEAVTAQTLESLYTACAKGGTDIMVERGGNAQKVGPLAE